MIEQAVRIDSTSLRRPHLQTAAHLLALGALLEQQGNLIEGRRLKLEGQALRREIANSISPPPKNINKAEGSGASPTSPVISSAHSPVR